MKPENPQRVQRVAQSGVILKKGADAPELGEVNRVWQAPRMESWDPALRPKDEATLRREQLRRAIVMGWSIALGVGAVAAVVVSFVIWLQPILNREKDVTERNRQASEVRVRKISKFKSPTEDEALALVNSALAARTEADVRKLIRLGPLTVPGPAEAGRGDSPGHATPAAVAEQLAAMQQTDGRIVEQNWLGSIDKNGLSLEGVELIFDEHDRTKNRLAILTPDERGIWQVDFAAYARSVDPPWEQLMDEGTPAGVVRVWVARDRYYNGPFLSDVQWVAYALASQDMAEPLFGYCRRWSAQHRAMELMWEGSGNLTARATLEVRRVPGAERQQFEITRVLAEDWVLAEHPFDEIMSGAR
jgi:hypothetical protein